MKNITYATAALLLASSLLFSSNNTYAVAVTGAEEVSHEDQVKAISMQAEEMQKQMDDLREKMAALEEQHKKIISQHSSIQKAKEPEKKAKLKAAPPHHHAPQPKKQAAAKKAAPTGIQTASASQAKAEAVSSPMINTDAGIGERSFDENQKLSEFATLPYGNTLLANIGGTAVITSPFIQSRYDFKGSSLITNYSSISKDVASLFQKKKFIHQMENAGLHIPNYPIVALSGQLKGAMLAARTFDGNHVNDIDLLTAELDVQAMVNSEFLGFMSLLYENIPPVVGPRVNNSRLFLDNGFITWGNFDKRPYYATIGQIYVPFGQYSTYLISDTFNKILFRTKGRALVLGYQAMDELGPYAAIYGFRGDSRKGEFIPDALSRRPNDHINTFGGDLGYTFKRGDWEGDIGLSVINNIADARGMQVTGLGPFKFEGFGSSSVDEVIEHRVPGFDVRGFVIWKSLNLIAEYTTATRAFAPINLSFNEHGAKPSAFHGESAYTFDLWARPSTFSLAYDHSDEALGLNLPKRRYAAVFSSALWPNTLLSLEYNHAVYYKEEDTASGQDGPIFIRPGKLSNAFIATFDVYF